jgi:hypothetical protein
VETGQPIGLSQDNLGDRLRVRFVRFASMATMAPMSLGQDARHLQNRRALRSREHTERVPVTAGPFEAPVGATEPLADGEGTLVTLSCRRKRDPIDDLTDRIEKDGGVGTLVTVHARRRRAYAPPVTDD